jgi:hypothetical protein
MHPSNVSASSVLPSEFHGSSPSVRFLLLRKHLPRISSLKKSSVASPPLPTMTRPWPHPHLGTSSCRTQRRPPCLGPLIEQQLGTTAPRGQQLNLATPSWRPPTNQSSRAPLHDAPYSLPPTDQFSSTPRRRRRGDGSLRELPDLGPTDGAALPGPN